MKRPRKSKTRISRGAKGSSPKTSKIRRTKTQSYGDKKDWEAIKSKVKIRDNHKCVKCTRTEDLQVDHIIPVASGGRTVMSNLWTLCLYCHCRRPKHQKVAKLLRAGSDYRKSKKKPIK